MKRNVFAAPLYPRPRLPSQIMPPLAQEELARQVVGGVLALTMAGLRLGTGQASPLLSYACMCMFCILIYLYVCSCMGCAGADDGGVAAGDGAGESAVMLCMYVYVMDTYILIYMFVYGVCWR